MTVDKTKLNSLIQGLNAEEMTTLKHILGGKLGGAKGKRAITPEQQAQMQESRRLKKAMKEPV
jgi:hypothetical protein